MAIGAIGGINNNYQQIKMDPDKYAQQYATQNGISVEEAKEKLKAQFGEPKSSSEVSSNQSVNQSSTQNNEDTSEIDKAKIASQLRALGIPDNIIEQGPEAVGEYAKEHNITLPEMSSSKNTDNYTGQNQLSDLNKFFMIKRKTA